MVDVHCLLIPYRQHNATVRPTWTSPSISRTTSYLGLAITLSSDELAELMACADVYVSPYKAEGFNLPVLESMALGVPVIITKGGPTDDFTNAAFAKYVDSERVPGE